LEDEHIFEGVRLEVQRRGSSDDREGKIRGEARGREDALAIVEGERSLVALTVVP